jgi:hypothetical protein
VGLAHYFNFFDDFSSCALLAIPIWRPLWVEARAHSFFEALLGWPSSSAACFLYFLFSFFFSILFSFFPFFCFIFKI